MQELDTLVLDHPTEVLDVPGRHRAAPPAARRTAARIAVSAAALIAVAGLGWVTADAVGLTSHDVTPAMEFPVASPRLDDDDQGWGRTLDVRATPTPTRAEQPTPDAVDAGSSGDPAAQAVQGGTLVREPQPTVEPARIRAVKVGDTCSSPGAIGVTTKGKQAVCISGEGPTRWKHA